MTGQVSNNSFPQDNVITTGISVETLLFFGILLHPPRSRLARGIEDIIDGWTIGDFIDGWTIGDIIDGWTIGDIRDGWAIGDNIDGWTTGDIIDGWTIADIIDGWTIEDISWVIVVSWVQNAETSLLHGLRRENPTRNHRDQKRMHNVLSRSAAPVCSIWYAVGDISLRRHSTVLLWKI